MVSVERREDRVLQIGGGGVVLAAAIVGIGIGKIAGETV